MQYAPSASLSKYIKHYLLFNVPSNDQRKYRHFSNGHQGLVFILKNGELTLLNSRTKLPETFVLGQLSKSQEFQIKGTVSVLIVLFQPSGFYELTSIPGSKYINSFEDSRLIFGNEILKLKERLQLCSDSSIMINYLDSYFTEKAKGRQHSMTPSLENAVGIINNEKGRLSVNELCAKTGITERKIQRLFFEQIGISPKKFIGNIRLHSFLRQLRNEGDFSSLTKLSLDAGYYDQAHLIREFQKIVGIAPTEYLKTSRLAVNLFEV
ncbi:helix-turn-helix domain-containing protein [Flagellimonas pacifica]|uniref:Transcriptional regulator, AraC family n=1 Tax=Flagellimonas pacifica TaxID=1247520 RepID=A0A285MWL1_9FLAO|nr:helix-turn-helix domain-containing protein [Allomuricauda parva]SNZ00917.1 transcriptional regulator, AraC family [Allomuricauda parva]